METLRESLKTVLEIINTVAEMKNELIDRLKVDRSETQIYIKKGRMLEKE